MSVSALPSPLSKLADLSNWRSLPFSQWAFQNVRDIIPCADVANAPDKVRPLSNDLQSFDSFCVRASDEETLDFDAFLATTATDALVVLHDGKIVHEYYNNGMGVHSPHILMSASKSIVGLIAGILHCGGAVDLESFVTDIVPEVGNSAYRGATLRNLLDMQTSVALDEHQLRAYNFATHWDLVADGEENDLRSFFEKLDGTPRPHGGNFRYVSANTDLLGWAIEKVTGKTFADLVSELLLAADGGC